MPTSSVRVLFVSLVLLAAVSDTLGFCNLLVTKFRVLGCASNKRFPCGIVDGKMRLLGCRQFACDGYRDDLSTFCTPFCRGLEIANGICRFGTKCCLNALDFKEASLTRNPGTDAFDLMMPDDDSDERGPGAN